MNINAWPRLMQRKMAAAYCDMSIPSFDAEVARGHLPTSTKLGGREHWCRNALDVAIDGLLSGTDVAPDYVQEMREKLCAKTAA